MKKEINQKKYDKAQFDNMLSMMNYIDANRVISIFESYLEQYPTDVSAYLYYAIMLIKLGQIEEAKEVLNQEIVITSKSYYDIKKRGYLIIKILMLEEKYKECYYYILENQNLFLDDLELNNFVLLFLKKKLNLLSRDDVRQSNSYLESQIILYQENVAYHHILLNHKNQESKEIKSQFNSDFPLADVMEKIKTLLPNEKRLYDEIVVDYYIFKYINNGQVSGKNANYIKVVTLFNTNQIVTMYPSTNQEKLPYIDLNFEVMIDDNKIKKISQIEKFNRRYKK